MSRYSDLVTEQGATNYWSLDESSAPYADTIGDVTLTYAEEASSELAVVNNGLTVSGAGFIRSAAGEASIIFNSSKGFSYSFLVNFSNYGTNRGIICKRQSTTVGRSFAAFVFNSSTGSGLSFDIGNNQMRWSTGFYPPVNEWVHIAYTYDPSTVTGRAYFNGKLLQTHDYSSPPNSTQLDANMMIGALQATAGGSASSPMSGSVDEVVIFTQKTLSLSEIQAQYATSLPITRVFDGTNWQDADKRVIC